MCSFRIINLEISFDNISTVLALYNLHTVHSILLLKYIVFIYQNRYTYLIKSKVFVLYTYLEFCDK